MKCYPVNINHPEKWKEDTMLSVDFYNNWFLNFAPQTYRNARNHSIKEVDKVLLLTDNLMKTDAEILGTYPEIFHILRLATAPPLAKARVEGLAKVPQSIVQNLEEGKLPKRMSAKELMVHLENIAGILVRLLDYDIFPWIERQIQPTKMERVRAASIIGDRLCATLADPIIRGEQERRQLATLSHLLDEKGYEKIVPSGMDSPRDFPNNCYAFHYNVKANVGTEAVVNIPVDLVVKPKHALPDDLPIMVELKVPGTLRIRTNAGKKRP